MDPKPVEINGYTYLYEITQPDDNSDAVDVYLNGEHIVGVYLNHDNNTIEVEGPEFQEQYGSEVYDQLCAMSTAQQFVQWAVSQIPEH